ncbi:MAG TPA: hypothetical protein VG709_00535 [Actinomycetota bacterium]|nr:hypothetical protein [Actinomycetota bacterium]
MTDWRWEEACEQVRARERNERSPGSRPGEDPTRLGLYVCECGDTSCRVPIMLTREEYDLVRSDATWFAVAPNHENPEIDHVVSEHPRFSTVAKVTGDLVRVARSETARAS